MVRSYDKDELEIVLRFLKQLGATVAAHNDKLETRKRGRRRAAR